MSMLLFDHDYTGFKSSVKRGNPPFVLMRMLSSRAFGLNDLTGKWQALAAAHFATQALIGAFGMGGAGAHGVSDFMFA
jgi:hypothetical protein